MLQAEKIWLDASKRIGNVQLAKYIQGKEKELEEKSQEGVENEAKTQYNKKTDDSTDATYNEKDYNDYGWARANDILNAGQNEDYRSKFADLTRGYKTFTKTKDGEYMIQPKIQSTSKSIQWRNKKACSKLYKTEGIFTQGNGNIYKQSY